jgi:hypothetical protein
MRIGPTDRGELSIVEADDRGALSLPQAEAGELSIADRA